MSRELDYFQRERFKSCVYRLTAQEWENFFCAVMGKHDSNFQQIKAVQGDGGNDGYRRGQGVYYACYGPEESQKESTLAYACKKAKDDFDKLRKNWHHIEPIRSYHPVFNDRYSGISSDMDVLMRQLKKDYSLDEAFFFLPKDLESIFTIVRAKI